MGATQRVVGVFGATGFIGSGVVERLSAAGWRVVRFSRRPPADTDGWRQVEGVPDLRGLHAVVNLAGESVAQRWSGPVWKRIVESRVGLTKAIVSAMAALDPKERPQVLLNASAVGYYRDSAEETISEEAGPGTDRLSVLCQDWEAAAGEAGELGLRVVLLRTGLVLGAGGEAWSKLRRLFSLGLGGRLGSGRQWMPWIHIDDEVAAIEFALETAEVEGPLNLSAPEPVTNREFTRLLAAELGRPAWFHAPGFALRAALGPFGETLLASYRMVPQRLQEAGFEFTHSRLEGALEDLCR